MNALGSVTIERSAEAPDAAGICRIWPGNGVPPGAEDWTWRESTMPAPWSNTGRRLSRNVVVPTLTVFRPAPGKANGTSMVIAPGGAFHFLMVDHEGYDMARWLNGLGVTAFVLKYRVARTPDADSELSDFRDGMWRQLEESRKNPAVKNPMTLEIRLAGEEDGRQAIRFVRQHAAEWGIDPLRIGIAGYSAGGSVAMGTAMEHNVQSRPDFAVGVYPPWREDLLVPANAPPLFLVISDDDTSVSPVAAARLYQAWHNSGAAAEFHVFGNGGHGWGMAREGWLSDIWVDLLANWLKVRGLLRG